jgi:hypothetical protein
MSSRGAANNPSARDQLEVILSRLNPLAQDAQQRQARRVPAVVAGRPREIDPVHSGTMRSLERIAGELKQLDAVPSDGKRAGGSAPQSASRQSVKPPPKPTSPKLFSKGMNQWLQSQGTDDLHRRRAAGKAPSAAHEPTGTGTGRKATPAPTPSTEFMVENALAPNALPGLIFSGMLPSPGDYMGMTPTIYVQAILTATKELSTRYHHRFRDRNSSKHVDLISTKLNLPVLGACLTHSDDFAAWKIRGPNPHGDEYDAADQEPQLQSTGVTAEPEAMLSSWAPLCDPALVHQSRPRPLPHVDTLGLQLSRQLQAFVDGGRWRHGDFSAHQTADGAIIGHVLVQAMPKLAPFPAEAVGVAEDDARAVEWYLRVTWSSPGIAAAAVVASPSALAADLNGGEVFPVGIRDEWIAEPACYASRAMDTLSVAFRKRMPRKVAFDFVLTASQSWFVHGVGPVQFDVAADRAWGYIDTNEVMLRLSPQPTLPPQRQQSTQRLPRGDSGSSSSSASKFRQIRSLPTRDDRIVAGESSSFRAHAPPLAKKTVASQPSTHDTAESADTCLLCGAVVRSCQCWD